MNYILKEESAEMIKSTYKNSYITGKLNLSKTYVSLILNRKKQVAQHMAFAITKAINSNLEIEDLFESVK